LNDELIYRVVGLRTYNLTYIIIMLTILNMTLILSYCNFLTRCWTNIAIQLRL